MQLDATTFVLQLVNFAVLVWILHRFLYRPVLAAIDRRRAAIEKTLSDAKAMRENTDRTKAQLEERIAGWERGRVKARTALEAELGALRAKGLAEVAQAVQQERERHAALQAKREADWRSETERSALEQSSGFAARLLERLAEPGLDVRLAEVLVCDLEGWPPERMAPLQEAARAAGGRVLVEAAHPLPEEALKRIAQALSQRLGTECRAEQRLDPELIAGVCVEVGPWLLQANLRDELRVFSGGAARAG